MRSWQRGRQLAALLGSEQRGRKGMPARFRARRMREEMTTSCIGPAAAEPFAGALGQVGQLHGFSSSLIWSRSRAARS